MAKTPFELRNEVLAQRVVKNLQRRAFDACYCATKEEALAKALSLIDKEQCVSWGGSMTLEEMGLLETLRTQGYNIIDRDTAKSQEERLELLRKALTCDTYEHQRYERGRRNGEYRRHRQPRGGNGIRS